MGKPNTLGRDDLAPGLLVIMKESFLDDLLLEEPVVTTWQGRFLLDGSHQASFQFRELVLDMLCETEVVSLVALRKPGGQSGERKGTYSQACQDCRR